MTVITGEFKNMNFLFLSAAEASKQTKTRRTVAPPVTKITQDYE